MNTGTNIVMSIAITNVYTIALTRIITIGMTMRITTTVDITTRITESTATTQSLIGEIRTIIGSGVTNMVMIITKF